MQVIVIGAELDQLIANPLNPMERYVAFLHSVPFELKVWKYEVICNVQDATLHVHVYNRMIAANAYDIDLPISDFEEMSSIGCEGYDWSKIKSTFITCRLMARIYHTIGAQCVMSISGTIYANESMLGPQTEQFAQLIGDGLEEELSIMNLAGLRVVSTSMIRTDMSITTNRLHYIMPCVAEPIPHILGAKE